MKGCIEHMVTGIAISLALTACAWQREKALALPDNETALITSADVGVWISAGAGARMTHSLRLLPGYSCVDVSTSPGFVGRRWDRVVGNFELCFDADAGGLYEVRVSRNPAQPPGRRWRIQTALIADAKTGEVLDAREAT